MTKMICLKIMKPWPKRKHSKLAMAKDDLPQPRWGCMTKAEDNRWRSQSDRQAAMSESSCRPSRQTYLRCTGQVSLVRHLDNMWCYQIWISKVNNSTRCTPPAPTMRFMKVQSELFRAHHPTSRTRKECTWWNRTWTRHKPSPNRKAQAKTGRWRGCPCRHLVQSMILSWTRRERLNVSNWKSTGRLGSLISWRHIWSISRKVPASKTTWNNNIWTIKDQQKQRARPCWLQMQNIRRRCMIWVSKVWGRLLLALLHLIQEIWMPRLAEQGISRRPKIHLVENHSIPWSLLWKWLKSMTHGTIRHQFKRRKSSEEGSQRFRSRHKFKIRSRSMPGPLFKTRMKSSPRILIGTRFWKIVRKHKIWELRMKMKICRKNKITNKSSTTTGFTTIRGSNLHPK